jgi:raffinose/stachyose/melibiose transport system permease protein
MSVQAPARAPVALRRQAGERPHAARRRSFAPWWFIVPALVLYAFVVLVPSARGAYLSLTDWNGINPVSHFIGLKNFLQALHDSAAKASVTQTLLLAFTVTVVQNFVGLLLALGVHSRIRSRNFLRVLLFAPAVMTPVVTAYLWQFIYSPTGALNGVLQATGLGFLQQDWLGNPHLALWSVIAVIVWQFAGVSMVIFLAGLQGIPQEIYEAADIDGAGSLRRFWYVIRPMLGPAITVNLMLSIIGGLKLFDQVWIMTGGGPGYATETLSTLIYKEAFQFNEFSYSIALALVLTLFVVVISAVQYRMLRWQEGHQ